MSGSRIAITAGEPAGIGPDIIAALAQQPSSRERVVIGCGDLLAERAEALGLRLTLSAYQAKTVPKPQAAGELTVCQVNLAEPVMPGELNTANAAYVLDTLNIACDGCRDGQFAAMVTAPVQKSVINDAGIAFSGHTEYLAERTETDRVVMLLATDTMRVALATTHLPLRDVSDAITSESLTRTLTIIHASLQQQFGITQPCIAVLGLNPHAGEGGHLGREELDVIIPALNSLRDSGMNLLGPLPADTAFNPTVLEQADVVLAMYHDQGLPVLKYAGFGDAVNITLGLPIIRTSVDHGTALDLASTGKASAQSLASAVEMAITMSEVKA